jgi:hypothetical protein
MATIIVDRQDMIALESLLNKIKGGTKPAIAFAVNDSMQSIRTEAVKLIGGKVTAKAMVIRKHFGINKMSSVDLSADINCRGKPLALINYSARSVMKGVTVKVLEAGNRKLVKHAFIATMASGHTGVFWREGRRAGIRPRRFPIGKKTKVPSPPKRSLMEKEGTTFQLPIHELYGPRIPDIFDDPEIISAVLDRASVTLGKRLEYHTNRLMAKAAQ